MSEQVENLKEYCVKSSTQSQEVRKALSDALIAHITENRPTQHAVMIGIADILCACAHAANLKHKDLVDSVDLSYTAFKGGNVMERMSELKGDRVMQDVVHSVFGDLRDEVPGGN